jgi:hypothetical protein
MLVVAKMVIQQHGFLSVPSGGVKLRKAVTNSQKQGIDNKRKTSHGTGSAIVTRFGV